MTNTKILSTNKLEPNDYNPNRMIEAEFTELVAEVRHLGRLPKPVVVRPGGNGDYTIIDGEHGWKAAKECDLTEISCEVMDADDFEAMRQTYKRNQHGTHNKLLLGRMFQRMMKERGLSLRKLAKQIAVSEGTIRNAIEYVKALKVRNSYAPDEDIEAKITALALRQVRIFNRLPKTIANLWLDGGADVDELPARGDFYEAACAYEGCYSSETEYIEDYYGCLEKSGLLKYLEVKNKDDFVRGLNTVRSWLQWENEYFYGKKECAEFYIPTKLEVGYTLEEFRKYAHFYYEEQWPFYRQDFMDYALDIVIKPPTEKTKAEFLLTPEEFEEVKKQFEKLQTDGGFVNDDVLTDHYKLAVYKKHGGKVDKEEPESVREKMMALKIEYGAPDYIRNSILDLEDKYDLWEVIEKIKNVFRNIIQQLYPNLEPEKAIESAAEELAQKSELPNWGKHCRENRKKGIHSVSVEMLRRNVIFEYIQNRIRDMSRQKTETEVNNAIEESTVAEIAEAIAHYVYPENPDRHKVMSLVLVKLEKEDAKKLLMALRRKY